MSYQPRVTIVTYTQFGPFQTGSTLVVNPSYARNLVNTYGAGLRIVSNFPGAYWFQNGAVLSVYPSYPVPPTPVPTPGTINVRFITDITDPVSGQTYSAGPLYRFTIDGLLRLNTRIGGLVFSLDAAQNNQIPVSQLRLYVGRTIYVDQAIFAFRQSNNANGNGIPNAFNANAV